MMDGILMEKYKTYTNAICSCKSRVLLLHRCLDEKVDSIGEADDQEFIYGLISVLCDLENDLTRLVGCGLRGAFGKLMPEE